jgi:hypothetical protein
MAKTLDQHFADWEAAAFGYGYRRRRGFHFAGAAPLSRAHAQLRGKNLACWCAPDALCHADVLLELANR